MNKKIVIIDYGLGNIHSIENAVKKLGYHAMVVRKPSELVEATHIILPGVGSFQHAMDNLNESGMNRAIIEAAKEKYILGICLGMQLLCKSSEENGLFKGLELIDARVLRFSETKGYSIPQIQWNKVFKDSNSILLKNIESDDFFYFLHSYYIRLDSNVDVVGTTRYCDNTYPSLIENGNIMAVQFHPEKSAESGLKLIENFIRRC